jgi:hypothetical protein
MSIDLSSLFVTKIYYLKFCQYLEIAQSFIHDHQRSNILNLSERYICNAKAGQQPASMTIEYHDPEMSREES